LPVETSGIRLGYARHLGDLPLPGPRLAITVAGIDEMSGRAASNSASARAGFDAEHTAYGIPFPSTKERFDRLEEQLAIITGLLGGRQSGEKFSLRGHVLPGPPTHPGCPSRWQSPRTAGDHRLATAPAPHSRRLAAAKYADEFNIAFSKRRRG